MLKNSEKQQLLNIFKSENIKYFARKAHLFFAFVSRTEYSLKVFVFLKIYHISLAIPCVKYVKDSLSEIKSRIESRLKK